MDCNPPGCSVHGILQARILEWVAIPFSRDLPDPGIKPGSPALQADSLPSEPPVKHLKGIIFHQSLTMCCHGKNQICPSLFYSPNLCVSCLVMSDSLPPLGLQPPGPSATGFSREEYWSGLPFPSSGDHPDLGIEPGSPTLQANSLPFEIQGSPNSPNLGMKVKVKVKSLSRVLTLRSHGLQSTRLLCLWDFPGKSTEVSCHFLLQGIFLTQGSNPGLLHCRQTLYPLSHQGSQFRYIK